ncbi:MAG: spore coat protein [Symbiobacterium sp.]|uniref:spore coat protein n=1 Tax=Symbiobacterium sp. TaxID=1971213 RepID=UPI003464733F
MADVDRLRDCLCSAKELARLYAEAALESTNNGVREFFLAMHGEETHNQEVLFSFLRTRGEYPIRWASPEHVAQVRRRFQAEHDQLGLTEPPSVRRYHTADPRAHPAHTEPPGHYQ